MATSRSQIIAELAHAAREGRQVPQLLSLTAENFGINAEAFMALVVEREMAGRQQRPSLQLATA